MRCCPFEHAPAQLWTLRLKIRNDDWRSKRSKRSKRGYSEPQRSTIGAASQRHISFLESARSQPSRELILELGTVLEIPLRQRNVQRLAAGFAPARHGVG
jgi:hypothetical protein